MTSQLIKILIDSVWMGVVRRIAAHLRRYLIFYVLLAVVLAVPIGYLLSGFFSAHRGQVKWAIVTLAVLTLFPSMVQLRAERMGSELREKPVQVLFGILLIFLVSPIMAMFLARLLPGAELGIGYVASNSVPASSASIAYVLLAEGNIELATALAILSILLALGIVPLYVGLYAHSVSVPVPLHALAESVAIALLVPLVLGQLVRHLAIRRRARILASRGIRDGPCGGSSPPGNGIECLEREIEKAMKPALSLWTMVSMLFLIGLLIANKAGLLLKMPVLAGEILGFQASIYGAIIALGILGSRVLSIGYGDHMGIMFVGLTKNESVAAAVSVLAIGPAAAIPAALIPAVQPVVAILYLGLADKIKVLLDGGGREG